MQFSVWALLCLTGCGCPPDADRFKRALDQVRAGEYDAINASRTPKIRDVDLPDLTTVPALRHLILDETAITDACFERLASSSRLESLSLADTCITSAGLQSIDRFPNLRYLRLDNVAITDESLAHVARLKQLRHLSLAGTTISGRGLAHLALLPNLCLLNLDETPITGRDVLLLRDCKSLRYLSLSRTENVLIDQVAELESAIPDLRIVY